ncbi:low-density lipoprotein receptor-related protein 12-like [Patiria miniata]|uniref:CUB domain-containing protein n=1 Tax=Patiria miniata TaxID=46514 RepID=A0A914AXK4_PATMI|nr:low-density lipoprotein receptor-related protein 12-like [Patiria miniata]XP_038067996.1 low-density lipoprotein receptor-related protein 12-like [Patiria miniata]
MEVVLLLVSILLLFGQYDCALPIVYLADSCNSTVQASNGGFIEPDKRLLYNSNLDCSTVLTADPGNRFLLRFYRFNLEEPVNGVCVDHLTIYDGLDRLSPLSAALCGRTKVADIVSSNNSINFGFMTDGDGSTNGFEIFYSVFTDAPCTVDQFACNNSRCIDAALKCDSYNMCGDNSDETDCDVVVIEDTGLSAAAIAGIVAGSLCLVLLIMAVIRAIIHRYQSNQLLKQLLDEMSKQPTTNEYSDKDFWGDKKPIEE